MSGVGIFSGLLSGGLLSGGLLSGIQIWPPSIGDCDATVFQWRVAKVTPAGQSYPS